MGTKLVPCSLCNIFMGKPEQSVLSAAPLKPSYYKCYIDDILIFWHALSENDLDTFISLKCIFSHAVTICSFYG